MRDTAIARDVFIFDEKHSLTEILDAWPRLLDPEIVNIFMVICINFKYNNLFKQREKKEKYIVQ